MPFLIIDIRHWGPPVKGPPTGAIPPYLAQNVTVTHTYSLTFPQQYGRYDLYLLHGNPRGKPPTDRRRRTYSEWQAKQQWEKTQSSPAVSSQRLAAETLYMPVKRTQRPAGVPEAHPAIRLCFMSVLPIHLITNYAPKRPTVNCTRRKTWLADVPIWLVIASGQCVDVRTGAEVKTHQTQDFVTRDPL